MKARQKKQLEKLYKRRLPPRELVTHEFARRLTEISREIRRQVGVLVNRKGEVEWVIVGSAKQIVLPDLKRLRVAELHVGESYMKLGNRKKAIEAYRKTLETDPNHLSARAKLDRLVVSGNESP